MTTNAREIPRPLANYAVGKWSGDTLFLAGVVAANPATGRVVRGYEDLPADVAATLATGQMSIDSKEGPIAAQAWFILDQIRQRNLVPIVLLSVLYLLDALIATANGAAVDAELLMSGASDSSIEVVFTMAQGVRDTLPSSGLLLVTARNGNYYVVERQESPPSRRPVAYVVPFDVVDSARTQRVNEADPALEDLVDEIMHEIATPTAP